MRNGIFVFLGQPASQLTASKSHPPQALPNFPAKSEVLMRFVKISGLLSLALLFVSTQSIKATTPETLAMNAVAPESKVSAPAIAELRQMGPAGLAALVQAHDSDIRAH